MDLRRQVVSKKLKELTQSRPNISTLEVIARDRVGSNDHFSLIDLSYNQLFDEDLADLLFLIEKLPSDPLTLDISHNRFLGKDSSFDEQFLKLLSNDKIRHLNVVGNGFASTNKVDLFNRFSKDLFSKLIFIPEPWLGGTGWYVLVPEDLRDFVLECHQSFFRDVKDYY